MTLHEKSIAELRRGLAAREFSATELTQHYLDRIGNNELNAFITTTTENALKTALDIDNGEAPVGLLTGIPIAHKDIFCTEGIKTSAGSHMLDNFIAPYTATAVSQCAEAGAILLGKTNMDEFAMGSSNENSWYGSVANPWDTSRVPGGSSGGSAAAVAGDLCVAATGTDTGGSIRQPASLCGITGLKPTYGRISRWGMIAFASSLDQAGPLAHSAEDCATLLQVMAGHDAKDSTSINTPVPDYLSTLNQSVEGLRIGVCSDFFGEGLDRESGERVVAAIAELEKQGAVISDVTLPASKHAVSAYYVIAPAECSANLSRFDGVRYGYRCDNPTDLKDLYKRSRSEALGAEVKQRILVGAFTLSTGYYDAYYAKAQKIRRLIKNDFLNAFNQVDIIVGPTSPNTAFPLGEKTDDPIAMYLQDIYTVPASLAGLPAMSIPVGLSNGLPVGMQLIGNYLDEARLLNVAHRFQQATDFHTLKPAGTGAAQ